MEGKIVILSVLIMCLLMTQNQVEARTCCPCRCARRIYSTCRGLGRSPRTCARISRCRIFSGSTCPSRFPNENLENSGGDDVNEYCNLGCESSVCGALTTMENSDASEIVNEALDEKCTKACSTFCATGSKTSLDQIALDEIALDQSALDQSA